MALTFWRSAWKIWAKDKLHSEGPALVGRLARPLVLRLYVGNVLFVNEHLQNDEMVTGEAPWPEGLPRMQLFSNHALNIVSVAHLHTINTILLQVLQLPEQLCYDLGSKVHLFHVVGERFHLLVESSRKQSPAQSLCHSSNKRVAEYILHSASARRGALNKVRVVKRAKL